MEIDQRLSVVVYSTVQQTEKRTKFIESFCFEISQFVIHTIHGLSRKLYKAFIELTPGTAPYCIPRTMFVQSILMSRTYCRTSTKSGRKDLFIE